MVWAPLTLSALGTAVLTTVSISGYSAVPIRDFNPILNWLYAAYLVCWIMFGTIGLPTLIGGILVMYGIGMEFFQVFSETWGYWGSIFGMALPWIMSILFCVVTPLEAVNNLLLVVWNILMGLIMWTALMLVWVINVPALTLHLDAKIRSHKKCKETWPDQEEKIQACIQKAWDVASSGVDEFPVGKEDVIVVNAKPVEDKVDKELKSEVSEGTDSDGWALEGNEMGDAVPANDTEAEDMNDDENEEDDAEDADEDDE